MSGPYKEVTSHYYNGGDSGMVVVGGVCDFVVGGGCGGSGGSGGSCGGDVSCDGAAAVAPNSDANSCAVGGGESDVDENVVSSGGASAAALENADIAA